MSNKKHLPFKHPFFKHPFFKHQFFNRLLFPPAPPSPKRTSKRKKAPVPQGFPPQNQRFIINLPQFLCRSGCSIRGIRRIAVTDIPYAAAGNNQKRKPDQTGKPRQPQRFEIRAVIQCRRNNYAAEKD